MGQRVITRKAMSMSFKARTSAIASVSPDISIRRPATLRYLLDCFDLGFFGVPFATHDFSLNLKIQTQECLMTL